MWTLCGGGPGAAVLSEAFERVNMSLPLFPAGLKDQPCWGQMQNARELRKCCTGGEVRLGTKAAELRVEEKHIWT